MNMFNDMENVGVITVLRIKKSTFYLNKVNAKGNISHTQKF